MSNVAYLFGSTPAVVTSAQPRAGYYYQTKKGETPWKISKVAYQDQGLTTVKKGLFLLNDNPANSHIKKGSSGWESYNVKGLQFTPDYAASPTAKHGSGNSYPILWVPPIDGRTPGGETGPPPPGPAGPVGPATPPHQSDPVIAIPAPPNIFATDGQETPE